MARNVEIKARLPNPSLTAAVAQSLSDCPPFHLKQVDTYFSVPIGRLKLRRIEGVRSEIIYYLRDNRRDVKQSRYVRFRIALPLLFRELLTFFFPLRGEVTKDRFVYLAGQTRIHLDHVLSLGSFLELEVVMQEGQTDDQGILIASKLKAALGVSEIDLVDCSYIDLIQ
jgi:adenylate cyclase class IV